MTSQKPNTVIFSPGLANASGKIEYPLKNDVILHCVSQRSSEFLKLLVSSFLGIPLSDIRSVHLENPIDFRTYDAKELILDIKVLLNNDQMINFEMQLNISRGVTWWINRSLLYLCRTFDNIKKGNDYTLLKPAAQISIIDHDLFPNEPPEFYAKYLLTNCRTGACYTSNFKLNVLYLNHIDLATQEDIDNHLVEWAKAFQASTWEDLKNLAVHTPEFKEVAEMMFDVDADVSARTYAEAHEKYLHDLATHKKIAYMDGYDDGRAEGRTEGYAEALAESEAEIKRLHEIITNAGLSLDQ